MLQPEDGASRFRCSSCGIFLKSTAPPSNLSTNLVEPSGPSQRIVSIQPVKPKTGFLNLIGRKLRKSGRKSAKMERPRSESSDSVLVQPVNQVEEAINLTSANSAEQINSPNQGTDIVQLDIQCPYCDARLMPPPGCFLFYCGECREKVDWTAFYEAPVSSEDIPTVYANTLPAPNRNSNRTSLNVLPTDRGSPDLAFETRGEFEARLARLVNSSAPSPVPLRNKPLPLINTGIEIYCENCCGRLEIPQLCLRVRCSCGKTYDFSASDEESSDIEPEISYHPIVPTTESSQNLLPITCIECFGRLIPPPGCYRFTCECGRFYDLSKRFQTSEERDGFVPRLQRVVSTSGTRTLSSDLTIRRILRPSVKPADGAPSRTPKIFVYPDSDDESRSSASSAKLGLENAFHGVSTGHERKNNKAAGNLKTLRNDLSPTEVASEITKAREFWIRNLGPDDKIFWVRLLSPEHEAEIKRLLKTCQKDMRERLIELTTDDVDVRLNQLGMSKLASNAKHLDDKKVILFNAKQHLEKASITELQKLLTALNVDFSTCTKKKHYVDRLLAAVWYGPTRFSDGFVREFLGQHEMRMIPAQQYGLPLCYKTYKISAAELEKISQSSFQKKVEWFHQICERHRPELKAENKISLNINRRDLLQDSFYKFSSLKAEDMRKHFSFTFAGEPGIDASGVSREWFELIVDSCFNLDFGLFQYSGVDNICYQFNPSSGIANELHREYFHFLGRVVGKALFDQKFIRAFLTQPIYKHILGYPITVEDIEFCDKDIYDSLKSLQYSDNVSESFLTFTCTSEIFGQLVETELKPRGADIEVTNANFQEYLMLMTNYYLFQRTQTQLQHFLKGIYEIVPELWLSVFDYRELELLLCGLPNINLSDWKRNTQYRGNYAHLGQKHTVIKWFWEYLDSCNQEQLARILQFCTGTSRVPISGFAGLQGRNGQITLFAIDSVPTTKLIYPRSHTCFNRVDLPEYKTKAELVKRFEEATSLNMTGFSDD